MFHGNFSCLFRNKTNKVQPVKKIQVWENKKVIHEVVFDDLNKQSNMYKEKGKNVRSKERKNYKKS